MMSAFLSRVVTVVTLEVVTPAFLTWSLALLSLPAFSVRTEEVGAGGGLWP
jgi:hypothetical protein